MNWGTPHAPPDTGGVAAPSRKRCEATAAAQTGWSGLPKCFGMLSLGRFPFPTTPSAPLKEASRLLLVVASTPPVSGGELLPHIHSTASMTARISLIPGTRGRRPAPTGQKNLPYDEVLCGLRRNDNFADLPTLPYSFHRLIVQLEHDAARIPDRNDQLVLCPVLAGHTGLEKFSRICCLSVRNNAYPALILRVYFKR